ncbi:surfeit locus protein 6 isoform X2 [Phyllopteryx taeniolatus]|uniref:surfeit locus protein 6 isoform X2 n=1 Tax=Phyllopteryx taeniolatus TaxID=161469 RepID=UPI002AD4585B|nr:surfeit locus protein 6 isoform X2 [Phyllopteryx taeniolatus]
MDLAARDSYIQKLTSKVLNSREQEPKKRPFAPFKGQKGTGPPQKKKKCKKKSLKDEKNHTATPVNKSRPASAHNGHLKVNATQTADEGNVKASFSTVDVLRRRLHEKIEEARAQAAPKEALSEAVQAKRAKRKLERERKKRKKNEFRLKKLAETKAQSEQVEVKQEEEEQREKAPAAAKRQENAIIFNTVETVEEEFVDKALKKKAKKQRIKGQITPLSGRNYKQLLSRVEARKDKLEKLREKDEAKAREMETRMKWTNLLYKAEGVKIKDDEAKLRTALANKEKKRNRRKKEWAERSQAVVEKMQKRQDKRRRNIQKRKNAKVEKKKNKARKKGRILAEDLKKVSL